MPKITTISATLRKQIRASGLSLYGLAKLSGVDIPRLSRFMRKERGLTLNATDKLCKALKLRLTPADQIKRRPKKKVRR